MAESFGKGDRYTKEDYRIHQGDLSGAREDDCGVIFKSGGWKISNRACGFLHISPIHVLSHWLNYSWRTHIRIPNKSRKERELNYDSWRTSLSGPSEIWKDTRPDWRRLVRRPRVQRLKISRCVSSIVCMLLLCSKDTPVNLEMLDMSDKLSLDGYHKVHAQCVPCKHIVYAPLLMISFSVL